MTTLVYRDGILAADSLITYGHTQMPGVAQKIHKLPNGDLYGFVGSLESGEIMRRWLVDEERQSRPIGPMKTDNFEALIASQEDGLLFFEDREWVKIRVPYVAMGSGKEHAYGALQVGASARQAVLAAMKLDAGTGGKLKTLEVRNWKGDRSSVEQCWSSIP